MTELTHYGVPGMKWGVRRSQATLDRKAGRAEKKAERKASDAKLNKVDVATFGKRGARRVQKSVSKGKTTKAARRAETGRQFAIAFLATAAPALPIVAIGAVAGVTTAADMGLRNRVHKQNAAFAKAGQEAAAAIFSDSRGLTSLNTISLNPSEYTRTN